MGTLFVGRSRISPYIKDYIDKIDIPENIDKNLKSMMHVYGQDIRISLEHLCVALNMKHNSKFTKKLLHVFCDGKHGFSETPLFHFYLTFRVQETNNTLLKALLTELLCGKKDKVAYSKIK